MGVNGECMTSLPELLLLVGNKHPSREWQPCYGDDDGLCTGAFFVEGSRFHGIKFELADLGANIRVEEDKTRPLRDHISKISVLKQMIPTNTSGHCRSKDLEISITLAERRPAGSGGNRAEFSLTQASSRSFCQSSPTSDHKEAGPFAFQSGVHGRSTWDPLYCQTTWLAVDPFG